MSQGKGPIRRWPPRDALPLPRRVDRGIDPEALAGAQSGLAQPGEQCSQCLFWGSPQRFFKHVVGEPRRGGLRIALIVRRVHVHVWSYPPTVDAWSLGRKESPP